MEETVGYELPFTDVFFLRNISLNFTDNAQKGEMGLFYLH